MISLSLANQLLLSADWFCSGQVLTALFGHWWWWWWWWRVVVVMAVMVVAVMVVVVMVVVIVVHKEVHKPES